MSRAKQVVLWLLGLLVSVATLVGGLARLRAKQAGAKIDDASDAEQAARIKMSEGVVRLAAIKRSLDQLPSAAPARSQSETDAELRRRGLIK